MHSPPLETLPPYTFTSQRSLVTLTGICAHLVEVSTVDAAAILLSSDPRRRLRRDGIAYPSLEKAQSLPIIAMRAITCPAGLSLGLIILSGSSNHHDASAAKRALESAEHVVQRHLSGPGCPPRLYRADGLDTQLH